MGVACVIGYTGATARTGSLGIAGSFTGDTRATGAMEY